MRNPEIAKNPSTARCPLQTSESQTSSGLPLIDPALKNTTTTARTRRSMSKLFSRLVLEFLLICLPCRSSRSFARRLLLHEPHPFLPSPGAFPSSEPFGACRQSCFHRSEPRTTQSTPRIPAPPPPAQSPQRWCSNAAGSSGLLQT